jgi:hypothetical protein
MNGKKAKTRNGKKRNGKKTKHFLTNLIFDLILWSLKFARDMSI